MTIPSPASIDELQRAVRESPSVKVVGGGTKTALSAGANLSTRALCGVLQYEPTEYTFTALAGTPVRDIVDMLAEHRQFLPFDPPLVEAGATIGGTVAAGMSGAGRFRFGGVRDFLLGVRLITGDARVVFGGGKVVKNAAGFDLPKLMVGALGRWGVLAELTFKVFPAPEACRTLRVHVDGITQATDVMTRLSMSQFDLTCLDWEPPHHIWLRIAGLSDSMDQRTQHLSETVNSDVEILESETEDQSWRDAREFTWVPADHTLIKMPLVSKQIEKVEQHLAMQPLPILRRYSVGGNLAWIAWPDAENESPDIWEDLPFPYLPLRGNHPSHRAIAASISTPFAQRLLTIFDPNAKCAS